MWLSVCSKVQIVCICPADATASQNPIPTLQKTEQFTFRLVLPFWYRLTQVLLEKRPLNGCSSNITYLFIANCETAVVLYTRIKQSAGLKYIKF